jgi:putative hydrolase of the HAD superfamily
MLRAVIFDFGGVLAFNPTPEQFVEQASSLGMDAAVFEQAFWANRLAYDRGEHNAASYWQAVTGRSFTNEELGPIIDRDNAFWGRLDDRVLALLRGFRAAGLRTALLSNMPTEMAAYVRQRPELEGHFDCLTFSCEISAAKPEAAIYEHCLRGLDVAPEEAMFIDDRAENVEGAKTLGIHAVLWRGN